MTCIYDPDLRILKMYLRTKNEVSTSSLLKLEHYTGQTNTQTEEPKITEHITSYHAGKNRCR